MYFYHNDQLAWISISKNACSTWQHEFENLGWTRDDLYNPACYLDQFTWFAFLREPDSRHTMGVVEYLLKTDQAHLLDDPSCNRLLVGAAFDEHTYPVSRIIPQWILDKMTFFILDQAYYDYEILVKRFLREHGVILDKKIERLWASTDIKLQMRAKLEVLKKQYSEDYKSLSKNILHPDQYLYARHLLLQHVWHRPEDQRR